MTTAVSQFPAAPSAAAVAHFEALMGVETDCWDVHHAMTAEAADFVLLDVLAPALFAAGHVPGAVDLPPGKMPARRMAEWPEGVLFVVSCAGPHCNGACKAAIRPARPGRPVTLKNGGIQGGRGRGF